MRCRRAVGPQWRFAGHGPQFLQPSGTATRVQARSAVAAVVFLGHSDHQRTVGTAVVHHEEFHAQHAHVAQMPVMNFAAAVSPLFKRAGADCLKHFCWSRPGCRRGAGWC